MENKRKNPHAVALGRKGGEKGGLKKWLQSLTPEERTKHQRGAANARWGKRK